METLLNYFSSIYIKNLKSSKWKIRVFLLCSHGPGLCSDPLLVISPVLTEAGVGLSLGRILNVGVVKEILDPQQDLLDGYGRPPVFLLVQDGETHCAGGVNVGVEQGGDELHLGRSRGEIVLEDDLAFVETALPGGSFLPGDSELPQHEIHGPVLVLHGPSDEPKGVVLPPGLSLFR